jgi:hypothetical protein
MPSYTIEETINKLLHATPPITALVSTRIYSNKPSNTAVVPYLFYRLEDEAFVEETFSTPSDMPRNAMLTISCVADRATAGTKAARDIAEAAFGMLLNYKGTPVVGGKEILAVHGMSIGANLDEDSASDEQSIVREVRATVCYR